MRDFFHFQHSYSTEWGPTTDLQTEDVSGVGMTESGSFYSRAY